MMWLVPVLILWAHIPAMADSGIRFYFSPHPDDWQLFMNPNAWNDVQQAGSKVVFVYVTAGDGSNGNGPLTTAHPYYAARENGARMAVRFVADSGAQPLDSPITQVSINGHLVARYVYRNTVSYFLRLPDGSLTGGGYASTGFQSLLRLHLGEIATLTAIDQSTVYYGWSDLSATVTALIRGEVGQCAGGWVNLPDPDVVRNPGDHPDHYQTAALVLNAVAREPDFTKAYYVDYATSSMPNNLSPDDAQIETVTFAQVIAGLNAFGWPAPWDQAHRSWLGKTYVRVDPGVDGTACPYLVGSLCTLQGVGAFQRPIRCVDPAWPHLVVHP
jgi:LmbE family N-acetylglucosaminyl deacetylase